ncbi:tetratricopeptide repeat protein [Streptomyces zagrosensis]|uniref:Tetratricopeptide (TPR) repeat protein n=1 Tax=Streptomyces zagrosensis TaxID=1042984 RepID=A0A7W9QB71_9ACTN|nr:tetratricopeptide repeat protein [Streptomyces zagrosensis]MBB5937046.1 tetratricopeptide (TPR) repeat protein [Streptomyces zagrosensis]
MSGRVYGPSIQAGAIHGNIHISTPGAHRLPPRQLPPDPRHFTNRSRLLARLDGLLGSGTRAFALLSGPAGVGKTSLAVHWLHRCSDQFPDGQLYVDLRGHEAGDPVAPSVVLPWFLRALGVEPERVPAELPEQAALFRTVTADRRIAVLCDNAVSAAQIRPLAPAGPAGACVVTSRWRLASLLLDGADVLHVEPLDTASAVELLGKVAGRDRVADDAAAQRLVHSCGHFPLAICVGAALLTTRPDWNVASAADGLAALRSGRPDEEVSMTASLDQSYALLPGHAARLYRRLGLHPTPGFGTGAAQAVAATPPTVNDVPRCLAALVEANLLTTPAAGRYAFHDLIQQHARTRAELDETPSACRETVARVADDYLSRANEADRLLHPKRRRPPAAYACPPPAPVAFDTATAALSWLDTERHNLLAIQRMAAEQGMHQANWQLAEALWALFVMMRYHHDWIDSYRLGVAGAIACGHQLGQARLRSGLGVAYREAGRHEDALREFALAGDIRRKIGDRRGEGLVLRNIALTYRFAGDLGRAQQVLREALAIHAEIGDTHAEAREYAALGEAESLAGKHEAAIDHLTRARAALLAAGDAYHAALAQRFLGEAHWRRGDLPAARAHLESALMEHDALGGDVFESGTLHERLGELAEEEGDATSARTSFVRAGVVYGRLGADSAAHRVARRHEGLDPHPAPGGGPHPSAPGGGPPPNLSETG